MQAGTMKQRLDTLDQLIAEAQKKKVTDDKLIAPARARLEELETQLSQVRKDSEQAKTLIGDKKQNLGLRLIRDGETAFKLALKEIQDFELRQEATQKAISELETERDVLLEQIAELRLKTEIPKEQESLHQAGFEHYQRFKAAFAECQKTHEELKRVAVELQGLGREYNGINKRIGHKYRHLKFTLVTPFDYPKGAGVQFFDDFIRFVERQAAMVSDGRVRLVLEKTE